jgi:mono/diheme cytochrome c family protein
MRSIRLLVIATLAAGASGARSLSADSQRGERLFQSEGCIHCHSVNGAGGKIAPDLGRRIDRDYTPASLASLMWNHAPTMWDAMSRQGIQVARLDEQAATDLFAYFYAVRFFDKPGDAARGKQLFSAKHCAECHGINDSKAPGVKPVAQWGSIGHPILLAEAMWNHAVNMREAFENRKIRWPEITGQNLTDLLVYLRNLPATRQLPSRLETVAEENGQTLFESKGCIQCHTGKLNLPPRLKGKTLTDIAAAMWSHAPLMAKVPAKFERDEMRRIVAYLWTQQIFQDSGNAAHGKKIFTAKHCADCHNDSASGAPDLSSRKGAFSTVSMNATLWRHGPRMLEQMKAKGIDWPRFSAGQMSDLIAYLNAGK